MRSARIRIVRVLKDTPDRVARMYGELLCGMYEEPDKHLKSIFSENYDEIVVLRDIPFYSICEHHMMPFIGSAHVAYLPTRGLFWVLASWPELSNASRAKATDSG